MSKDLQQQIEAEHPGARVTVLNADDSGPYKIYDVVIRKKMFTYNSNYPEGNKCICGHAYYRHFDPYENWDAVGCKYCACTHFVHEEGVSRISPFERTERFGLYSVDLDDYIVQWEMFGHVFYPTLAEFLGSKLSDWLKLLHYESVFPESNSGADDFVEVV